jgi:putative nucleotidyltransferase with HDIG domain
MAPRLETLVQHIGSLPTLPTVLLRVNDLVSNPKTSAQQLSRVVMEDQSLTVRLLRLVNSPFYGFPRRISTVTETLTILGFNQVRNLLLTVTVVDLLGGEESEDFSPMRLWQHSVGTAVAASVLAKQTGHQDREELFVAGLLHDVGKLVAFQVARKFFLQAIQIGRTRDLLLRDAEVEVFGYSHDQVGRLLAEQWKLPMRLTETIACHHRPDLAQAAQREAAIIHLADIISRALGLGSGGDDAVPPLSAEAWHRVRLVSSALGGLMKDIEAQYEDAQQLLLRQAPVRPGTAEQLTHVS